LRDQGLSEEGIDGEDDGEDNGEDMLDHAAPKDIIRQ
jgi:hypothetical protein